MRQLVLIAAAAAALAAPGAAAAAEQTAVDLPPPPELLGMKWKTPPSVFELGRLYPKQAVVNKIKRGMAEVACTPRADGKLDCEVLREDPAGNGFGQAALGVMKKAVVAGADGGSPAGKRFGFTVRFGDWPASAVTERALAIHGLTWASAPKLGTDVTLRPARTRPYAQLSCEVLTGGALDCTAQQASEEWFGQAAVAAAEQARVRATDGKPLEGRKFQYAMGLSRQDPRIYNRN